MNANNVVWLLVLAALFPWACVAVAAFITPRLTRPDLFFAVTVNASFRASPAGADILRQYQRLVLLAAALGLLPLLCLRWGNALIMVGLLGPAMLVLAGTFGAFLVARSRTLLHHVEPTAEREAPVAPRSVSLPGGWLAQAGPFLILGAVCLCLWLSWERIPARIPVHWGATGWPDGWTMKHPVSVFAGALIGLLVCLLLGGISRAILSSVRRVHCRGRAGQGEARFVRALLWFLLGVEYWLALLMGSLSLVALRPNPQAPLRLFWLIPVAELVLVTTVFLLAYRMGQGGWRLAAAGAERLEDSPPVGDRTPDECWKLGLIYFNPNDPAFLVEKRFGVGWTLNFANPRAWLFLGAVLLFILVALGIAFSGAVSTRGAG